VRRPCRYLLAIGLAGCIQSAAPAAAATFTWSGASATANWSSPSNWGGTAPNGAVGDLDFPALGPVCSGASPPSCYESTNDLSGLSVGGLTIDDGAGYEITGDAAHAITLGSDGITAAPSPTDAAPPNDAGASVDVPLTLVAPQTWTITGGGSVTSRQELVLPATVSGIPTDALAITLSGVAGLTFVAADVGPVTVTGDGGVADGFVKLGYFDKTGALVAGSLNAEDGQPVTVTDGAGLLSVEGTVGPLVTAGGLLQIGQVNHAGTLTVDGSVALDPLSAVLAFLNQPGTTPGSDASQLSATGDVDLDNATLALEDGEIPGTNVCEQLSAGDTDTLVTTVGALTGTFTALVNGRLVGVPDGATIPLGCQGSGGAPPTAVIHYTTSSVTATVVTPGGPGSPTTTALALNPASPVTDQQVTLTATVTSTGAVPSGTVEFFEGVGGNSAPILGCDAVPLTSADAANSATCVTSFAASPAVSVSAAYTPADGSTLAASATAGVAVNVGRAPTTTSLGISASSTGPGQPLTMTATGTVAFLVNGAPIPAGPDGPGCSGVSLTSGSLTATCQVQLTGGSGSTPETITATYSGDGNFAPSTSGPQTATYIATSTPPGTAPPPGAARPPAVSAVGIGRAGFGRASVTATMADLVVTCAGKRGERCSVSLKLTSREKLRGGEVISATAAKVGSVATQSTVVVGTRSVTLAAGHGEVVHVALSAAGRRLLSRVHKLPVTLTAAQKTSKGSAKPTLRRLNFGSAARAKS
jgi:hypothetical protein